MLWSFIFSGDRCILYEPDYDCLWQNILTIRYLPPARLLQI
jgi:hypothetical protein